MVADVACAEGVDIEVSQGQSKPTSPRHGSAAVSVPRRLEKALWVGHSRRPMSGGVRRLRIPTQVHSHAPAPPQPLGCGPLLQLRRSVQQTGGSHACAIVDNGRGSPCCQGKEGRKVRFRCPSEKERQAAMGSNVGLVFMMQRVLRFAEVWFEPIPEPRLDDWLSLQSELMQTFQAFKNAFARYQAEVGPTAERQCVHLLPLGSTEFPAGLLPQIRDICGGFFWPLRAALLRPHTPSHCGCADGSLDANALLTWMKPRLRADSVMLVGLSTAALTNRGAPTVGASDWESRIAVVSVGTCQESSDKIVQGTELTESGIFLERSAKLVLHQATHMFGILHCCYYRCLMNGSSCLEEADSKPPYLCGICLKKLHLVLGFNVLDRYMRLATAWTRAGCEDTGRWYETRVTSVCSVLAGCQPSHQSPTHEACDDMEGANADGPAVSAVRSRPATARRGTACVPRPRNTGRNEVSVDNSYQPGVRPPSRGASGRGCLLQSLNHKRPFENPDGPHLVVVDKSADP
eukprot:TRINITY_DN40787_c0_g1_i1.p1 TRINITY_DN40787_c0_g1~~TRINITY_DN40787_c0_g1_i1.p1  ORF type:complete len:561 (+),score=27.27 TRINITY_DN40787_c0_g1_i1:131-1684(+)